MARLLLRRLNTCTACIAAMMAIASIAACTSRDPAPNTGPLRIVVSIPPLVGLVRPLVTTDHDITMLIKPGQSCHGHEMIPSDAAAIARADVVVYIGLGLEPQIEGMLKSRPDSRRRVVCFADAVGIRADDHAHHHHGPDEECDHGPVDPHLWVDPVLARQVIPVIGKAVREAMQGRATAEEIAQSHEAEAVLLAEIDALGTELRDVLKPARGQSIVTHHDAFSRLVRDHGITVAAVIRPIATDEPKPAEIATAVRALKEQGARGVFIEPQFSSAAASRIAESAGVPLGRLDVFGDGDWFAMMRANAREIARILAPTEAR